MDFWRNLYLIALAENFLGVVLAEKLKIGAIFFTAGLFLHPVKQAGRGEGDRDAIDLEDDLVFRGFFVTDAAGGCHEVHADSIADTDDGVFRDFAGFEFKHGFVGEGFEGFIDLGLVFGIGGDDEIEVHGFPAVTCSTNGETADNDIAGS